MVGRQSKCNVFGILAIMFYNDDIKLLFFCKGNDSPSTALTVFRYCLPHHLLVRFALFASAPAASGGAFAYLRRYVVFAPYEIRIIGGRSFFDLLSPIFELLPSYIMRDIDISTSTSCCWIFLIVLYRFLNDAYLPFFFLFLFFYNRFSVLYYLSTT